MTAIRTVKYKASFPIDLAKRARYIRVKSGAGPANDYVNRVIIKCLSFRVGGLRGRRRDELMPDLRVVGFGRSANLYFRAEASRIVFIALLGAGLSDEKLREILVRRDQDFEL